MNDGPTAPTQRWYQQGWFPLAFILVVVAVAVIIIRVRPGTDAPGAAQRAITLNPRALQSVPKTDVDVRSYDDPQFGNPDAKVTVIEFGDFQCPYCRQAFPAFREVMQAYRDRVLFIYRDYPIAEEHSDAQKAAEGGQCAWEQGENQFWAYHDRLFLHQEDLSVTALKRYAGESGLDRQRFDACLDSGQFAGEVASDYNDGVRAGVRGTPTFFINQRRFEGPISRTLFEQILNTELGGG